MEDISYTVSTGISDTWYSCMIRCGITITRILSSRTLRKMRCFQPEFASPINQRGMKLWNNRLHKCSRKVKSRFLMKINLLFVPVGISYLNISTSVFKYHVSCTDVRIWDRIKIEITFIFRFHRRPFQLVMFVSVGLLSICWHLLQVLLVVEILL